MTARPLPPGHARLAADSFADSPETVFPLELAGGFWSRFCGLMLRRAPDEARGLLLLRCTSIHTAFMRYALDVAYLDRAGRVLSCRAGLKPWRLSFGPKGCAHVLELKAGDAARLGIAPGRRIEHPCFVRG
jgi:uncharacterized membrane protein (UPF0127 family)